MLCCSIILCRIIFCCFKLCWSIFYHTSASQIKLLYYYYILYYVILYHTMPRNTLLYYSTQYFTILHHTMLRNTILHYTILCYTIPYHTMLRNTTLYNTIPYYTVLHYSTQYCNKLNWSKRGRNFCIMQHNFLFCRRIIRYGLRTFYTIIYDSTKFVTNQST